MHWLTGDGGIVRENTWNACQRKENEHKDEPVCNATCLIIYPAVGRTKKSLHQTANCTLLVLQATASST